jgi:hypothetical protein
MTCDADFLAREARHLHACFFDTEIPTEVVDRYVRANQLCFPDYDEPSLRLLSRLVDRRLDVEAVELVLRTTRRQRLLTRKVQILFYLLEVRSAYYSRFVNTRPDAFAVLKLAAEVIRTGLKFGKGQYLIRKHELV